MEAEEQLRALRGPRAPAARGGVAGASRRIGVAGAWRRRRWRVRDFSEEFLQAYLDREWEAVRANVGVYRVEGPGAQLFERVEGSHWAVLGLPLLPLLEALREQGV
jgi:septum formation protein